jgi:hypothetical protein
MADSMAKQKIKLFDAIDTDPFPGQANWPLRGTIELLQAKELLIPVGERSTAKIKNINTMVINYDHMLTGQELLDLKVSMAKEALQTAVSTGLAPAQVVQLLADIDAII